MLSDGTAQGCGTGLSMYMVQAAWPSAQLLGVDMSTYKLAISQAKLEKKPASVRSKVREPWLVPRWDWLVAEEIDRIVLSGFEEECLSGLSRRSGSCLDRGRLVLMVFLRAHPWADPVCLLEHVTRWV